MEDGGERRATEAMPDDDGRRMKHGGEDRAKEEMTVEESGWTAGKREAGQL